MFLKEFCAFIKINNFVSLVSTGRNPVKKVFFGKSILHVRFSAWKEITYDFIESIESCIITSLAVIMYHLKRFMLKAELHLETTSHI